MKTDCDTCKMLENKEYTEISKCIIWGRGSKDINARPTENPRTFSFKFPVFQNFASDKVYSIKYQFFGIYKL